MKEVKKSTKTILIVAIALVLMLALAACGGRSNNSGAAQGGGETGGNSNSESASSDTPSEAGPSGGNSGGFKNLMGDPLTVPETASSFEGAVGVSAEGQRIVRKYTDKFFEVVSKPDGCTIIYSVYEFDAGTGEVSDAQLWYGGFSDETLFRAAFQNLLDQTFENHVRGYNVSEGYYGYYTWPAIQDMDNDGVVTWEDAVSGGDYDENDVNYILIK